MEIISSSTQETKEFAHKIASRLKGGEVLLLFGDLGAGKTTFTNFLVSELGFTDRVQSPTFVLHRKYSKSNGISSIKLVNHLDLYRLKNHSEFVDLGLAEMITPDSITLIEWPDKYISYIKGTIIKLYFENVSENVRRIHVPDIH